jgi:formamidopyrimidine-DNA glycosylase
LDDAFTGAVLARAIEGKMTPIKAAILDQKIVAGVGNIYACEALFQAGLSPTRLAGSLTRAQADKLVAAIKDVLTRAIAVGGSSLRDHVQVSGELGYFQHAWAVYGKEGEPCPGCACKEGVQRMVQSNRSTFYCAKKQR